jgi:hypothetical protein
MQDGPKLWYGHSKLRTCHLTITNFQKFVRAGNALIVTSFNGIERDPLHSTLLIVDVSSISAVKFIL